MTGKKSFKKKWDEQSSNRKAIIILGLCFIGLFLIIGLVIANQGPEITYLEIDNPVNIYNDEIGKYSYENYTTDNKTKQITISGRTNPNANITAYIIYNLESASPYSGTDSFLDDKQTKVTKIKVDPNTGTFKFNINTNPNYNWPSFVYIEAESPNKESNAVELIIISPALSKIISEIDSDNSTDTTTENTSNSDSGYIQKLTKDEMGYEHGYLDGYYGDTAGSYSGEFGDGYNRGYQIGWYDAQNNLKPEWEILGTYYRWSPSDVAYYDTRTNEIV